MFDTYLTGVDSGEELSLICIDGDISAVPTRSWTAVSPKYTITRETGHFTSCDRVPLCRGGQWFWLLLNA